MLYRVCRQEVRQQQRTYGHTIDMQMSVQMATTLSTNCNWWCCVRTAKATFPYWKLLFLSSIFKQLFLKNCAVDFVEICNVCARKVIIKAAKRIFDSDKICRSYCDFYFGVTFFGTHCISLLAWNCIFTPAFNAFCGIFPSNDVSQHPNPQMSHSCAETRRLSRQTWKSVQPFDLSAVSRKKQSNKSQSGLYRLFGQKPPLYRLKPKFAWWVISIQEHVWSFKINISGDTILHTIGDRMSYFPIDFCMGHWVQRYCVAWYLNTSNNECYMFTILQKRRQCFNSGIKLFMVLQYRIVS